MLVLGGIVITVQGFETVCYLGDQYDAETRVWASRLAQAIAAVIYIGFVAVATPVMGSGPRAGADTTLLDVTGRVAPILVSGVAAITLAATVQTYTIGAVASRKLGYGTLAMVMAAITLLAAPAG